jgi:hypothetical protein
LRSRFPVDVTASTVKVVPDTVTGAPVAVVLMSPLAVAVPVPAIETPPVAVTVVKLIVVPVALRVDPVPVIEIAADPVTVVAPVSVTFPTEVIAPVANVVLVERRTTVLEELVVAVETLVPVTAIGAVEAVVVSAPLTVVPAEPVIEIPELPDTAAKLIVVPVAETTSPVPDAAGRNVSLLAIQAVLSELAAAVPGEFLHLGGDEVNASCWSSTSPAWRSMMAPSTRWWCATLRPPANALPKPTRRVPVARTGARCTDCP